MVGRFRFRLESLLKLRKSLEQEAQRHLSRSIRQRNEVADRLEELRSRHRSALEARRVEPGQPIDLTLWRAIERYLVVLEHRIGLVTEELHQAEAQVEAARLALTEAHQQYLMLLRLKERRQAQHESERLREEASAADELAVLRHGFQIRSSRGAP